MSVANGLNLNGGSRSLGATSVGGAGLSTACGVLTATSVGLLSVVVRMNCFTNCPP